MPRQAWLCRARRSGGGAEDGAPVDVAREGALGPRQLDRVGPVGGGELEDSLLGPPGEQAQEIAQVGPGLERMELSARDEGDEVGVDLSGVVGASQGYQVCEAD